MGQLRVGVLDATCPGRFDNNDAYCKFYLNEQMVFKTRAIKLSWQPAETFEVEVRSRIDARFSVTEYELDTYLGTEKVVGNAVIDLQLLEPCMPQDFKIQVAEASGSIRLQILFIPEWTTRARRFAIS